jgi:hypothetical protein
MLAIVLIILMAMVAVAGLDKLPRNVRAAVQTAGQQVKTDQGRLQANRQAIERALAADPSLFGAQAGEWRKRLDAAQTRLGEAGKQMTLLQALAEENRREDREKVEQGLEKLRSARAGAVEVSDEIRRDVERWSGYKRDLPARLAAMRGAYEKLRAWDPAASLAPAQKAMADWPEKRTALEQRIQRLMDIKQAGETAWESTADARAAAEAPGAAGVNYAALFAAGDRLDDSVKQVSEGAAEVIALSKQLYVDRNKVLLELQDDGEKRQEVRVVETTFPSAALKDGRTTEQRRWERIDDARFQELEDKVGMVIERKPAGVFDSEANRTPQAPAYAYVAPPGQSNRYGSWSNGTWHWLPQYLILSQLLRGSQYPPITAGDYRDYDRARRSGGVWYGRDNRYRTWGRTGSAARRALDSLRRTARDSRGWYQERSPGTSPRASRSGGFSGSRYQSRGTFSGSRYRSRGGFGSRSYSRGFGRSFGRSFGRIGRR